MENSVKKGALPSAVPFACCKTCGKPQFLPLKTVKWEEWDGLVLCSLRGLRKGNIELNRSDGDWRAEVGTVNQKGLAPLFCLSLLEPA